MENVKSSLTWRGRGAAIVITGVGGRKSNYVTECESDS